MAEMFDQQGIPSAALVSGIDDSQCSDLLEKLRAGRLTFLFTVDKLSEGLDVPDIICAGTRLGTRSGNQNRSICICLESHVL